MSWSYVITAIPSAANPEPAVLLQGTAATEQDTRRSMLDALVLKGISTGHAGLMANQTSRSWTDFGETGLTAWLRETS